MTLRQLRQMASDLGVTLYSRKSKEDLVSAIAKKQERRSGDLKAIEAELNPPSRLQSETRVVFLPRDPSGPMCFGRFQTTIVAALKAKAPRTSIFVWLM